MFVVERIDVNLDVLFMLWIKRSTVYLARISTINEGEKYSVTEKETKYKERNKSDSESKNYYDTLYESDDDDNESIEYDDINA